MSCRSLILVCAAVVGAASISHDAGALVWPDVAARVERDLSSPDPATRRTAARELAALGPNRGAPLAIAALADTDDEVRLAAADAAIDLRAAGATAAVAKWLNASDARLRRKACEVARALPSDSALAPLARTLGDPDPDVRSAAADALGRQTSKDAVPALLGRLDDPTPAVRIQIVGALARLGDDRAVVPLVGKVQDSSPEVRQAVARALGELGDARAAAALVLSLRDANDEVRREALEALGQLRAADAVDSIAPFASDRNPGLRSAALTALGHIGSADAVRVLIRALDASDEAAGSVDATAARSALALAGDAARPQLHALLSSSPSPAEVSGAAWVFGALHERAEAPAIVAALRRGVLPPAAAMHALAGTRDASETPVVLEYVADPNPTVRSEALDAAAALLDPAHPDGRAVEPLAAALSETSPAAPERARIATLLGKTGAARAAPLLVDLTRSSDGAVRLAAVDALGDVGPAGADDALLTAMKATDAPTRLHAAMALARTGGAAARERLLTSVDGDDEIDRAALLTALGGVLERVPSDAAVVRLSRALDLAAGPERDAIIEAMGRARCPAAVHALAALTGSSDVVDRRDAAILLAGHAGEAGAVDAARSLLADTDPSVRAQAAWTLGAIGAADDVPRLEALTHGADPDVGANAAAAIGRVAARTGATAAAAHALCPRVVDERGYVRANALAGLAIAGARCGGAPERSVLSNDPNDDARAAAALALWRSSDAEDVRALERCARTDPDGRVAARCHTRPSTPKQAHPVLVYVVDGNTAPRPGGPYAIVLADGTIHTGTTDRRGAVFDPVAPEGELSLRSPSALAR